VAQSQQLLMQQIVEIQRRCGAKSRFIFMPRVTQRVPADGQIE
jgi:hypothetical protein